MNLKFPVQCIPFLLPVHNCLGLAFFVFFYFRQLCVSSFFGVLRLYHLLASRLVDLLVLVLVLSLPLVRFLLLWFACF